MTQSQRMSFYPGLPVPRELPVGTTPPHPCPYLPDRLSVSRGFVCESLPGWAYQELMDAGFRRSGTFFYQMVCPGCRACVQLRVTTASFRMGKSQRRVWRRNADLVLSSGEPALTGEKQELYGRYLAARHPGGMSSDWEDLEDFLYRSPVETVELCYRDPGGRLLGVGICDVTSRALSSVYFYFDPDEPRRSLGIFSALAEIRAARLFGRSFYYPGYWVAGCAKMTYKASFRPFELLGTDGVWRPSCKELLDRLAGS